MCLLVRNDLHKDSLPLIAENDIRVYKTLVESKNYPDGSHKVKPGQYVTPHRLFPIEFDSTGKFVYKKTPMVTNVTEWNAVIVNEGLHSYYKINATLTPRERDSIMCDAIIPAGSKYYIGSDDDIVSNQLIVFETHEAFINYVKEYGINPINFYHL